MSYSITKNTTFLTFASVVQKVITFLYFTIIARVMGVDNTSQYFLAIAFSMIFIVFADFGLSSVLTRESSRFPKKIQVFFNTVLSNKLLFGVISYLLIVMAANLLNYPVLTKHLIYFAGLTMFFDNIHSTFYAVFRAKQNLKYESIGLVVSQLITLIIGTVAIINGWSLIWLIIAYTISSFLNGIYVAFFAWQLYGLTFKFSYQKANVKMFLMMAWPFALAGIVGRLYIFTDSLLMSKMLVPKYLGWWSVSYKLSAVFQFIPIALSASIYPVFSKLFIEDKKKIKIILYKSYRYLLLIVLPISAGIIALAIPIVQFIYGVQYLPAVLPLQILMISLVFSFLTFVNGVLLNSINKQKIQTAIVTIVLIFSVVLNIILIPRFNIIGSALTALISNIILFKIGFYLSKRFVGLRYGQIFLYFNQYFWPALIMGIIVYLLSTHFYFLLTIPLGIIIYFLLVFLTKGLDVDMIKRAKLKIIGK